MRRTAVITAATAAVAMSLAACAPAARVGTGGPLPPERMQCDASGAKWAIGRAPDRDVVERARIDAHADVVRVLRPGDAATMDLRGDRLNVRVNARGAIDVLDCG